MSASHSDSGHADGAHTEAGGHGSFKGYVTGFLLSLLLTAIPFWLVMGHVFAQSSTAVLVLFGFAAVQIVVHMVYFLHMTTRAEGGWSLLALLFTAMLVVITLSGSVWVMYHLNSNMMPQPAAMRSMQETP
jgi:cytochrome o ubiquinol oxidase operon protein cyoD